MNLARLGANFTSSARLSVKVVKEVWKAAGDTNPPGRLRSVVCLLTGWNMFQFFILTRDLQSWMASIRLAIFAFACWTAGWCMNFLFEKWWKKRLVASVVSEPHDVQFLTTAEMTHLNTHGTCPDCAVGSLLEGPRGGCSMNMKCDNPDCRHEFNLAKHQGHYVFGNRIDRDDPTLYREAMSLE